MLLLSLMYNFLAEHFSYNIFFVLSGGGTLNYFGTKGFIEQELEGFVLFAEFCPHS